MRGVPIPALDGYELAGAEHLPAGEGAAGARGGADSDAAGRRAGVDWTGSDAVERVVLIAPAVGVPGRFYHPLADFLAERGLASVTWDWRGVGRSAPERLRGFEATMRDWAEKDLAGVVAWASRRFPGARLQVVGHSFGGQAVGLLPDPNRIRAMVMVAVQSGYWGHWPRPEKYAYAALWYVAMPLASHALGYFPARLFRLGEDLPKGVALQWARWCRDPEYMGDWEGHRAFRGPILNLHFTDDAFAPPSSRRFLHEQYGSPEKKMRVYAPGEVGAKGVGHMGFFRRGVVPGLWEEVAGWLAER